jgi:hypothetical protein
MWQDIRSYFDEFWNLLELASPLLVGAGMVCHDFLDDADSARQLHSWAVLVLWLRLLEICERFESVGPLVSVIVRMLSVLIQFSVLCGVFTVAWSMGLYALLRADEAQAMASNTTAISSDWSKEYASLPVSVFTLFKVYVGDFGYSFAGAEHSTAASIMLGVYLVLIVVLLMNLLIAVLSVEHAEVYEDIDKEFAFTRTAATLRMRQKVEEHTLPPPLNLLQLPSTGLSWLCGRGLMGGNLGRRTAWLCWLLLATPVLIVPGVPVGILTFVAMGLQVGELPFVKTKNRDMLSVLPLLGRLDPEGRYFRPLLGLLFIVLGPVIMLLGLIPGVISWLKLVVRLLLGFEDVGGLTFDAQRSVSAADADALRRKHWPDKDWADLISAVVGEVFSTAEVDDGTANPLRLNSDGRMRWLCERTLQSGRNDGELKQTVAQQEDKMEKRLECTEERTKEMMEERLERTDAKVDSIDAQVAEMRSMIAQLVALQAGGAAAPARVAHYALGD